MLDEVTFGVVAAKAFREREHGALSYFMKLDRGQVFFDTMPGLPEPGWEKVPDTIADQDLPGTTLHLLFGTESGELLGTQYSGDRLSPVSVHIFKEDLSRPPKSDMSWKLPWDSIEELFAATPRSPA